MIGIYKFWSLFSYFGLLFGIYYAKENNPIVAILFLLLAGLIDLFDGTVAKKFKRNSKEKQFGIEIDSILDTINFGAVPAIIYLNMGFTHYYDYLIVFIYLFVVTMRLAYFNTILVDQKGDNKRFDIYYGFPVTTISLFMCLGYNLFLITKLKIITSLTLLISSFLFITKIKIKRYKNKFFNISLIAIGTILVLFLLIK